MAGRLGYSVSGDIEAIPFDFKRQRRERDLEFVRRMAEDFGYFFSVKDQQFVFHKREELENQDPVRIFEIAEGQDTNSWSAQEGTHKTFKEAKVRYLKGETKEVIKGEARDASAKSGDVLKIDERVETKSVAKKTRQGPARQGQRE